jgi:hypothetical protein
MSRVERIVLPTRLWLFSKETPRHLFRHSCYRFILRVLRLHCLFVPTSCDRHSEMLIANSAANHLHPFAARIRVSTQDRLIANGTQRNAVRRTTRRWGLAHHNFESVRRTLFPSEFAATFTRVGDIYGD